MEQLVFKYVEMVFGKIIMFFQINYVKHLKLIIKGSPCESTCLTCNGPLNS